eukprot:Gregarina_sp_Poly_1__2127@NODE_1563_length_3842_cov_229_088477_g281_i1_p2_GENE_NODE_1563_length_3842_cov_229_088477_g281_i1NODE_1563_length_3842_cov_229_088477_g281_i1_p2_ORF_typecomplete_len457_score61_98RNase_Zc3h12a/PF11977_8/0_06_NODE_1563_length_3842_cov_229_088477_g281_i16291999
MFDDLERRLMGELEAGGNSSESDPEEWGAPQMSRTKRTERVSQKVRLEAQRILPADFDAPFRPPNRRRGCGRGSFLHSRGGPRSMSTLQPRNGDRDRDADRRRNSGILNSYRYRFNIARRHFVDKRNADLLSPVFATSDQAHDQEFCEVQKAVAANWQLLPQKLKGSQLEVAMSERMRDLDNGSTSSFISFLPDVENYYTPKPPWPWDLHPHAASSGSLRPYVIDALDVAYHHGERRGFLSFAGLVLVFRSIKRHDPQQPILILFLEDELQAYWQYRRTELFPDNKSCYESLMSSDVIRILPVKPFNSFLGIRSQTSMERQVLPILCREVIMNNNWPSQARLKDFSQQQLFRHCQTRSRYARTLGKVELICRFVQKLNGLLISNDFKQFAELGLLEDDSGTKMDKPCPPSEDQETRPSTAASTEEEISLFEYMNVHRMLFVFPTTRAFIFATDKIH